MSMNDFKRENRLYLAGRIRLGYKIKKCPTCKEKIVVKEALVDTCPKCSANLKEVAVYPISTPHFVLDDVPELIAIYGEQPTRLNVYFPFNGLDENMPAFHKFRQASSLVCQGDGTKITYAINPQTGKPIIRDGIALVDFEESDAEGKRVQFHRGEFMACPGYQHDAYKKCSFCKPNTTLRFLIREVPRMAYFEIVTKSVHNFLTLDGQLHYFCDPEPDGLGLGLKYVPFFLDIRPAMISTPNLDKKGNPKNGPDGKPQPKILTEKYLLSLEIEPSFMARLTRAKRQLMDPVRLMLSAPMPAADEWIDDDNEDYEDEEPGTVEIIPPPAAAAPEPAQAEKKPEIVKQDPPAANSESLGRRLKQQLPEIVKQDPPAANGKPKPARPMTPAQIKETLVKPRYGDTKAPEETALDLASAALIEACKGESAARDQILKYLFGKEAAAQLTTGECIFITDWIGIKAETGFKPDPNALAEVEAILLDLASAEQPPERVPADEWWNQVDPPAEARQAELSL